MIWCSITAISFKGIFNCESHFSDIKMIETLKRWKKVEIKLRDQWKVVDYLI